MQIILTHEVAGLGLPGDVVDVKDGYGRNYLLPQSLAIRSTPGAAKQAEQLKKARQAREIRDLDSAHEASEKLRGLPVILRVRASNEGRLYGSVTKTGIAEAVATAGGPEVDHRRIQLASPIKSSGHHRISVRLHPEVVAEFTLDVVAKK